MAEYSYCYKCSILLREKDFAKGKAVRVGGNVACSACAPPVETPRPTPRPTRSTSVRIKTVEDVPSGSRRWIAAGAGALLVFGAGALLLFLPGNPPPAAGPTPAPPPAPVADPPKLSPRESAAREALEKARKAAREKPEELAAQARALEEVVWNWEGTAAASDARKALDLLKAQIREKAVAGLAALDAALAEPLAREDFGAVVDLLETSSRKADAPEWVAGISKRRGDVESKARTRLDEWVRKAVAHKGKGETGEVNLIDARVAGWKLPALLASFRGEVEAAALGAAPAPAARNPEAQAYLAGWKSAAAKATARDFDGAVAELRKAAAGLQEEALKKEAARDIDDLRAAGDLLRSMVEAAAALPPGKSISVEVRGSEGPRRVSGTLVRVNRDRAEIKTGKGPEFAEWSEATTSWLARLAPGADTRRLALLALLEGDVEGAKARLEGKLEALPELLWTYGAAAKPPGPSREEQAARELYYAAEREYAAMGTRGPAVEKYRTLKGELAATALVRVELDRILRRSEAGKEYLFTPADARMAGTFKRSRDGPAVSLKDTDVQEAVENSFETEFYAMPGTSYRAWLLLGGCCREVLSFYLQGTEMTASERGKRVSIEPGENRADFLPSTVLGLKKEHKDHAKNKEPKTPAKWDWVPVTLPKYATPGAKKLRLMTNQQGFGVNGVLISSLRTGPPRPAELEELLKARAKDVPPAVGDPDLVVHWTFDEAGGAAEDATGNGFAGAPQGGVKREPGKLGGAAAFDGVSGFVEAKDAPELRLAEDLTIAFWMRKDAEAEDWVRLVGKGTGEKRNYGVWESPAADKRILWQIYLEAGGPMISLQSNGTVEAGRWHHVACVRRGKVGQIFIDGRKDAEGACEGVPARMDAPLTAAFGAGAGHTYFKGALDDVRLYRRALTPEEIATLFDAGQ